MSSTGLDAFDKTVQTTNIWLNEICDEIGPDKQLAWHVLGVVLRTLRDRLPPDLSAHVASQLPVLVRGAYYDQYRPAEQPKPIRSREEFVEQIGSGLSNVRRVNPEAAARAVFHTLNRHLPAGQVTKARGALPQEVQALWADGGGDQVSGGTRARSPM